EKLLIDVSGDEITVTDKETGEPYAMSENFRIEDLYNSIEALYNQYNGMTKPVCETYSYYDNIEVTYDTENHIPTKIYAKGQSGNGQTFGFYNHDKKIEDFQKK
ncbi:MAG: hypothetical protein J6W76_06080, partial [Spirochaetales bacterium]|nr:hypothetical protein [Spirochaetales bacterium]